MHVCPTLIMGIVLDVVVTVISVCCEAGRSRYVEEKLMEERLIVERLFELTLSRCCVSRCLCLDVVFAFFDVVYNEPIDDICL